MLVCNASSGLYNRRFMDSGSIVLCEATAEIMGLKLREENSKNGDKAFEVS